MDTPVKRHTVRKTEAKQRLRNRLLRAIGQLNAVKEMLERDEYCPDIMVQVQATMGALAGFNRELLTQHVRTCFVDDIRAGREEAPAELARLLQKLMA